MEKKLFKVRLCYCRLRQLPTLSPKLCFSSFTPGLSCFAKIRFGRATCSFPPIMLILVPCSFEDQGLGSWIIWSWFPALWVWDHHFSLLSQVSPSPPPPTTTYSSWSSHSSVLGGYLHLLVFLDEN